MILKLKTNIYQLFKLIFLIYLANNSYLFAHNFFNGGCGNHCESKVKKIINKNKLKNINYQNQLDNDNSCLNKSLCRG